MYNLVTSVLTAWNSQEPHKTARDALQRLSWSVFPLDSSKRPPAIAGQFHPDGNPKRLGWKKYQNERATLPLITSWEANYHPASYAVITGTISRLIILDFDGEKGRETLERLKLNPHVKTGSGGYHVYFKHPGWHVPTLNSKTKIALGAAWPGLDIRGDGGYAAFCGSNANGSYTWQRDPELDELTLLPDDLRAMLGLLHAPEEKTIDQAPRTAQAPAEKKQRLIDYTLEKYLREARSRGRDNACFDLAVQLRDNEVSESEAIAVALEYARWVHTTDQKGHPAPFTEAEARAKVESAYSRSARQSWESSTPRNVLSMTRATGNGGNGRDGYSIPPAVYPDEPFHCTDLGNAERFALRYQDAVRWCETWNTWLVFNGKCWEPDKTGRVDRLAKIVVRSIYSEAARTEDEDLRKRLAKHAAASESNRAVRAMLDRSKSELPAAPEDFNKDLYLFNCDNGTLDLRTGKLRPHSPQDMLTRCIKIKYDPHATRERWRSFLNKFLDHDQDLIKFIIQALGMSLCGDTSEQCLFICHGMGNNGKTTLLETIRIIMGLYACAANIETFQMRKNETIGNDIAELYGARLVTASETKLGGRLNEAFVKKATGKEPLRARRLHENEFEFMPEFTLWLAVNHKPVVLDTSKGMWRRVHFIPFNVTIDGDQVDIHYGDKLLEEAEGILADLVQGCMEWIQQGRLIVPQIVQEATAGYRAEMDIVANFLRDECILAPGKKAQTKKLIERFESWCEHNSEKFDAKILKNSLKERGFQSQKGTGGVYYWQDIGLMDNADTSLDELWSEEDSGGTNSDLSLESGGSGRSGPKNKVNRESKNPPDATLNSRPLPPLPPLPEREMEEKSDGTSTIPQSITSSEPASNIELDTANRKVAAALLARIEKAKGGQVILWKVQGSIYPAEEVPMKEFKRRVQAEMEADGDGSHNVVTWLRTLARQEISS